jgi:hypothetical protein
MNFWTLASVSVAVVTTGILPAFLGRSRRLIGAEPSPCLLTYVLVLSPRWIATGVLVMQCVCLSNWGAAQPELVRYFMALVLHALAGLVSFFSIAAGPADLKAVPAWISRGLVALGFVQPLALVVLCVWYLERRPGLETSGVCLGTAAGWTFLVSLGFGAAVLLWALAADLRRQALVSLNASRSPAGSGSSDGKSTSIP